MAKAARKVRSGFVAPALPALNAQDFLDFFGEGQQTPRDRFDRETGTPEPSRTHAPTNILDPTKAPEGVRRYAPGFVPILRQTENLSIGSQQGIDGDDQFIQSTPGQRFETPGEVVARNQLQSGQKLGPVASTSTRTVRGDPLDGFGGGDTEQLVRPTFHGDFGSRSNKILTPAWQTAYDAALIKFRAESDERVKQNKIREGQIKGRKERKDRKLAEGGGGVGSAGTTLITGAQGFLGGQGAESSLLK